MGESALIWSAFVLVGSEPAFNAFPPAPAVVTTYVAPAVATPAPFTYPSTPGIPAPGVVGPSTSFPAGTRTVPTITPAIPVVRFGVTRFVPCTSG